MTCPNCGAPITDPDGAFCSRCGAALAAPEAEATERFTPAPVTAPGSSTNADATPPAEPTTEIDGAAETASKEASTGPLLTDYAAAVRRRMSESWLDPIGAACLAFLVLLSLGALLLIAAKLQFPGFGAGANPVEILSAITILGLAILRAPVHVGDLVISVLPLGALLAAGLGIAWATSVTFGDKREPSALAGATVGIPFGLICWFAALVFRFDGRDAVFSGAWGSLLWGLVWGSLFGALGGMRERKSRRRLMTTLTDAGEGGTFRRGATAAAVALSTAGVMAAVAALLWIIVALVRGVPGPRFGAGDAAAAFVYLLAFAPNIIVSLTALGMGAPVYVGARVTVAGADVGQIDRVWLFGDAPGYVALLVVIPIVACSLAGFWARRVSQPGDLLRVIGTFAGLFALSLAVLAWLGEARLGAALLGRGLARLDVNALATLFFGFLWAAGAGTAGWFLADKGAKGVEG